MAKKKYYAVKAGKTPGVYETWDACKAQVHGFPGAIYKSFPTKKEAEYFVNGMQSDAEEHAVSQPESEVIAYVDGSYNQGTGEYGYGVVFFYQDEELHYTGKGNDPEMASMRNVAGEILGATCAMEKAIEQGAKSITIYHDYQGIASWPLGEWKANKNGTKAYKEYFDSIKNVLAIRFQKVKGHSGDQWNDLADELAKSAIF